MERLWEFIEHLVPGLIIVILVYLKSNSLVLKQLADAIPKLDPVLLGAILVGISYMVGVFNSAICRFIFTETRVMDVVRGWYLKKLCMTNATLAEHVAKQSGYKSFSQLDATVQFGSCSKWRSSRAAFHNASGNILQKQDSKLAKEIADRRQEARTLRASIFPLSFLVQFYFGWPWFAGAFLLTVCAYLYREASIADSIEHGI